MARDVNDVIVFGLGSWSDVYGLATLGFGQAAAATPAAYCLEESQIYAAGGAFAANAARSVQDQVFTASMVRGKAGCC